jgi:hypothetical protein
MDKLTAADKAELTKCSSERLVARLIKAGIPEEVVLAKDRAALLEAAAELKLTPGAYAIAEVSKPLAIWEQELALRKAELKAREEERKAELEFRAAESRRQEERHQAELKAREAELKAREDERKADLEFRAAEARRQEEVHKAQIEYQAAEAIRYEASMRTQEERWKAEVDFREAEAGRQQQARLAELDFRSSQREDEKTLLGRTQKYTAAIKNVFPSMPADSAELPSYLDNVDNLFQLYEVPRDLRSRLLLSHLTGKAKSIVSKLSVAQLADYDAVRQCLLTEFQVTPRELRSRFIGASKKADESYSVFRARLELNLTHYLRSRKVDSFDKLLDLFVADKLKDTLAPGALRYVLGLEGDSCFTSQRVANAADIHESNYNQDDSYKAATVSNLSLHNYKSFNRFNKHGKFGKGANTYHTEGNEAVKSQLRSGFVGSGNAASAVVSVPRNVPGHVQQIRETVTGTPSVNDKPVSKQNFTGKPFTKRTCFVCGSELHHAGQCPDRYGAGVKRATNACAAGVSTAESKFETEVKVTADCLAVNCDRPKVVRSVFETSDVTTSRVHDCVNVGRCDNDKPTCDTVSCGSVDLALPEVKFSNLKYTDVVIAGNVYKALIDSGSELPLIKSSLVKDISYIGSINIQPVVGKPVPANLAVLDVAHYDESVVDAVGKLQGDCCDNRRPLHLVFAVTDLATHDVVLPVSVVDDLLKTSHKCMDVCQDTEATLKLCSDNVAVQDINLQDTSEVNSAVPAGGISETFDDVINIDFLYNCDSGDTENVSSSRAQLIQDQLDDVSLKASRSLAERGKGGYRWINGLLCHYDKVLNQSVTQVVAPADRRLAIMAFAHDKSFHQGHKKTCERVRYSFFWPTLRSDVIKYVASCEPCQLKRRLVTKDRVPISPIERPGLPGEHLMMDIVGPIEPASSMGHKYILNVICLHTRWPFSYVLRRIDAKFICDCLCDVFSHLGVASVISSDCGSNFTSQLTQTFLERKGCTPRFNSPVHPEASGTVERFNQTFKRLLHHAITNHARQWHKCIPFVLWALRESGNETTGLPPYTLLYGHQPRGPLHVLCESWTGDRSLPATLHKSDIEYMTELKQHLSIVRAQADVHAETAQAAYVSSYNKRACDKSFEIGEKVIVLFADSTSKLKSWWQTGIIIDVFDEYSYLVELPNGSCKQIHANHLRPFTVRVNSVIVVQDTDFGDIVPTLPYELSQLPSSALNRDILSHLSEVEQQQLLSLLDEFAVCFSAKPGLILNGEHEIVTTPDFKPKRLKPYKIPEVLKVEVENQIDQLLRDGFIEPSTSCMISPIVCVMKHDKFNSGKRDIRIVCDFRYLNKHTVIDRFPVPDQEEILNKLASFKYISVFDARSGYWQTQVKKECQPLLGFATHHGLWQWKRTPFGCKNSGSTFIRAIEHVLKPVRDITATYVDDMGVGSDSWTDHLVDLRRFLTVLKESGVTLNLAKAEFAKPHVKFLGHVVGSGRKDPDPDKISAILSIPRPTTHKQVKSFLGMMSYHRMYIDHLADVAKPLTDLTSGKPSRSFVWSLEHETAFLTLKECLCNVVSLNVPRISSLFVLRTDASGVAISGCLYQRDDDIIDNVSVSGEGEHPISFFSQVLSRSQRAWSTIEREAFAVIASLRKFHQIVFGSHIVIFSDHNPLTFLVEGSPHSAKLTRWSLALQQYDITFRYVKAKNNRVADYFSRCVAGAI